MHLLSSKDSGSDDGEDSDDDEDEYDKDDSDDAKDRYDDEDSDIDRDIPQLIQVMTDQSILSFGLAQVGFGEKRQVKARMSLNVKRFRAFYGVGPQTVKAIFDDLRDNHPSIKLRDLLMTLNWFKLYDTEHVLAGRWGYCEDHIRGKVKAYGKKIQSLKNDKIVFGNFHPKEIYIISVDGVNFSTQEFRLDPSSKWFDHKSKSAGLTYELALAIHRQQLVWINGPFPSGARHDSTIFRGGTKDTKKDKWDQSSLFFKMPSGKRAVGDSGYKGIPNVTITRRDHSKGLKKFLTRAKQRQESFHTRLKSFHILGHRFRHGSSTKNKMQTHQMCVEAICVIVQYDMENGHPLFEV